MTHSYGSSSYLNIEVFPNSLINNHGSGTSESSPVSLSSFPEIFGLPCCCCQVTSVMSDSVRPHRRQPTRLPHPWDSPGKNTGVGCHFLLQCMKVKSESDVAQSCPTLSDPMDCSLPGSSVHGIFQARVLEWVAIAFSVGLPYSPANKGQFLVQREPTGVAGVKYFEYSPQTPFEPTGPHSPSPCQPPFGRLFPFPYFIPLGCLADRVLIVGSHHEVAHGATMGHLGQHQLQTAAVTEGR